MKKTFLFSLIIFVVVNSFSKNLELTLSQDKNDFLEGEPIWVTVTIENKGTQEEEVTLITRSVLYLALNFNLYNSKNTVYNYKGGVAGMPKIPTTILKPGEAIYEYFDLLEFYGELYVSFIKGVRHFLKPDTYFLYAELSTSGEKINSNQIKFYVVEPVQEESKAYELFKEGLFTWLGKKEDQKAANIFRKLITDYANSVYAELSFDYLQACYKIGLHDYKKAIEVGEELISKHPKSPFSGRMIKYLAYAYEHVEGKEKVKERLMQLTDKYGDVNPGIKKNALMMINRLEK